MTFYYKDLLDILRFAEDKMRKNKETREFWSEELEFISEMKSFLFKDENLWYEIKGSDPF